MCYPICPSRWISSLSLHDALPILNVAIERPVEQPPSDEADDADGDRVLEGKRVANRQHPLADAQRVGVAEDRMRERARRSEEHTSELQSPCKLVCRLLREKNNIP